MSWQSLRIFFIVLVMTSPSKAFAENQFTGTYVADARPHELIYLALTQTKDSVAGVMTIVSPDGDGGVSNQTLPVRGTADGGTINLVAERFLSKLAVSGKKSDELIVLAFPGESGGLATRSFSPASESEFNAVVAKWRQLLITIHAEKDRMETEKQEADAEVQKLATALFNDVRNIRNTGIGDDLERITAAIKDERSALRDLGENLSELKSSASVRPMTCYQAYQTVAYNFRQAMGYTYNQTLGYANSQYRSAMGTLELRLSHVDAIVGGIRESASKLKDEIRVSKFTPPALDIAPGDELGPVDQYLKLARSARDNAPVLKSENEQILANAKALIDEGKLVMDQAQSIVRCR